MDKSFVPNVWALMKRELWAYFGSPIAYVVIVIFLLITGFFTFNISRFFEAGQASLRDFFGWFPWIFLFLAPSVAMRLWSDERKTGTMELLFTLPVTMPQAILAKFLAAWIFFGIATALTFPMVITVAYLGNPDMGAIFCGYVASFLMGGAYLAVGSMTSAVTKNQVISFVLALVLCLFFVMAGWPPVTGPLAHLNLQWLVDIVEGFSFYTHFKSMERGVIDLRDVLYFVSVIFFMLFATGVILQNRKAS